jgi:predicted aconitase with swiveling domain
MTKSSKKPITTEQTVKVQIFLIVGVKGSGTGSKVAVESVEAGKALLKEIFFAINSGKPLINEERGIVYNGTEISHAFLTIEQVK